MSKKIMNKKKDLNYFKKLNYNIILKKKKGDYYLYIPELSLIVEAKNLKDAYRNLEKEKDLYFKRIIFLDAQDTVKEPLIISLRKKLLEELLIFFIKTLIIVFIFILIFFLSLPYINRSINQLPNKMANCVINFSEKLENMSLENKERIRLHLKNISQELKPYADEVKVLWQDEEVDLNIKYENYIQ